MRGVKSHGPRSLLQTHKYPSVDHCLLKPWALTFPFSGFKDRVRCTAGVGCWLQAHAGESNVEFGAGRKGLQKDPAFGLGLVSEG